MVRLKAYYGARQVRLVKFQFHYGTIKSFHLFKFLCLAALFQFHYGTIKSNNGKYLINGNRHFNSTMVRLKEEDGTPEHEAEYEFQFHYGTIKSMIPCHTFQAVPLFQFHYGTIKSPEISWDAVIYYLDFNSTMVRLKDLSRNV